MSYLMPLWCHILQIAPFTVWLIESTATAIQDSYTSFSFCPVHPHFALPHKYWMKDWYQHKVFCILFISHHWGASIISKVDDSNRLLTSKSQHFLPLVLQNMHWSYNRGKSKRKEMLPNISVKPCCRAACSYCVSETNKRPPRGVLTRTGPQTVRPKSYKLLWCLNKTHINLSSVIFLWRSPTLKCFHLTFI